MSRVEELIRLVAVEHAAEIVAETGFDEEAMYATETLEHLGLAPDDNEPPTAPSGVTVVAGMRALFVNWPIAPPAERVRTTHVQLTNTVSGTVSVRKARHQDGGAYVDQLNEGVAPHQHLVEVAHEDAYGRLGAWTAPITATPGTSTVDELSADRITAGLIDAAIGITSGGKVEATATNDVGERVGVGMYPTGLELIGTGRYLTAPSTDRGSKITNSGSPFGELYYFDVAGATGAESPRGMHIRADGTGPTGTRPAQLRFEALQSGNPGGNLSAKAILRSGAEAAAGQQQLQVEPYLEVVGGASAGLPYGGGGRFNGPLRANSLNVGAGGDFGGNVSAGGSMSASRFVAQHERTLTLNSGGSTTYAHGLGGRPSGFHVYVAASGSFNSIHDFAEAQFAASFTDTQINIVNNSAAQRTFLIVAYL